MGTGQNATKQNCIKGQFCTRGLNCTKGHFCTRDKKNTYKKQKKKLEVTSIKTKRRKK